MSNNVGAKPVGFIHATDGSERKRAGGDGSSGIRGTLAKTWAMSATELKNYGTALLNQSYACAFVNWRYDASYYGRTDIKNALADLGGKARSHAKTSCKQ